MINKFTRKLLALSTCIGAFFTSQAQFIPNGSNLYWINGGVSIGITTPRWGKLHIYGIGMDNGLCVSSRYTNSALRMYLGSDLKGYLTIGGVETNGLTFDVTGQVGVGTKVFTKNGVANKFAVAGDTWVDGTITATDFVDDNGESIASKWNMNADNTISPKALVVLPEGADIVDADGETIRTKWMENTDNSVSPKGSIVKIAENKLYIDNYYNHTTLDASGIGFSYYGPSGKFSLSARNSGLNIMSTNAAKITLVNDYYSAADAGYILESNAGIFRIKAFEDESKTYMKITKNTDGSGTVAIDGRLEAEEIEVLNVGADFVFADDYSLRSLEEVEAFIKENKHLPEIAPASETEKGIEIGAFSEQLLMKVEELTLYIIEQQKQIESLNSKINELTK